MDGFKTSPSEGGDKHVDEDIATHGSNPGIKPVHHQGKATPKKEETAESETDAKPEKKRRVPLGKHVHITQLGTQDSVLKRILHWFMVKKLRLSIPIIVLLLAGAGIFLLLRGEEQAEQPVVVSAEEPVEEIEEAPPEPPTAISPLTGEEVLEELANRPITGVMIENSLVARPQSGLAEADVVFEAVAEGGITRYLAMYQSGTPDYIGPVRSAREQFVYWLTPYDASYAHVGGSTTGLNAVRAYLTKDLDQYFNASTYTRISERTSPHNVYTDFERLDALNASKGHTASDFEAWTRDTETKPAETPVVTKVNMSVSGFNFDPVYTYDQDTNTYSRSLGGQEQKDEDGAAHTPSVVIAMQISYTFDGPSYNYNEVGSGNVWIFQNGDVYPGKWTKSSVTSQISFTDNTGAEIALAPGQTWITAVTGATWE